MNWEVTFKPTAAPVTTAHDEVDEETTPKMITKTTITGEFTVPYISDENGDDAPTVRYTIATSASDDETKKSIAMVSTLLKSAGVPFVQKQCQEFVKLLKKEFVQQKNSTGGEPATTVDPTSINTAPKVTSSTVINTTTKATPVVKKPTTKTLKLKEEFQCSPMDAYDVFVNINKLRAFTQSDCVFENQEGTGKFSLYGGSITGVNKTLSPGSKIVQSWRLSSWEKDVESTVTLTFSVDGRALTNVELVQTGIPIDEFEKTEEGWRRNIFDRIKQTFSYSTKFI